MWPRFVRTLKAAFRKWSDDRAARLGAALAYYALFSIAPLLMVAVGVAGLIFGEEAARGEVVGSIEKGVGSSVAGFLEDMMVQAQAGTGVAAIVIGSGLALLGASGLFIQLNGALNVVWDVPVRATKGIVRMLRSRSLSFLFVLGVGVLLIAVLTVSSVVSALEKFLRDDQSFPVLSLQWLSPSVTLLLLTVVFAMIFRWLPDASPPWPAVWRGAAFTSVLFTIGVYLLGLYVGNGAVASSFGAAAALVTLLLTTYYLAQIFLLGAEFTRVLQLEMEAGPAPGREPAASSGRPAASRRTADTTPVAAVWAFMVGLVLGWWKGK